MSRTRGAFAATGFAKTGFETYDPTDLTVVTLSGALYSPDGTKITSGALTLTPKASIRNGPLLVSAKPTTFPVPSTGNFFFQVAPSNGVPYDVVFDPDPDDTVTPTALKSGAFDAVWTVPDVATALVQSLGGTAFWRFNDGVVGTRQNTHNVLTASLGGMNGIGGSDTITYRQPGSSADGDKSMLFSGGHAADHFIVPDGPALHLPGGHASMSMWFKVPSSSPGTICRPMGAVNTAAGFTFKFNGGQITGSFGGLSTSVGTSGTAPALDVWHLIVLTWDGTTLNMYIDKVLVASSPATGTAQMGTGGLAFGTDSVGSNRYNGYIDDVALFNAALTQSQVTQLYNLSAQTIVNIGSL